MAEFDDQQLEQLQDTINEANQAATDASTKSLENEVSIELLQAALDNFEPGTGGSTNVGTGGILQELDLDKDYTYDAEKTQYFVYEESFFTLQTNYTAGDGLNLTNFRPFPYKTTFAGVDNTTLTYKRLSGLAGIVANRQSMYFLVDGSLKVLYDNNSVSFDTGITGIDQYFIRSSSSLEYIVYTKLGEPKKIYQTILSITNTAVTTTTPEALLHEYTRDADIVKFGAATDSLIILDTVGSIVQVATVTSEETVVHTNMVGMHVFEVSNGSSSYTEITFWGMSNVYYLFVQSTSVIKSLLSQYSTYVAANVDKAAFSFYLIGDELRYKDRPDDEFVSGVKDISYSGLNNINVLIGDKIYEVTSVSTLLQLKAGTLVPDIEYPGIENLIDRSYPHANGGKYYFLINGIPYIADEPADANTTTTEATSFTEAVAVVTSRDVVSSASTLPIYSRSLIEAVTQAAADILALQAGGAGGTAITGTGIVSLLRALDEANKLSWNDLTDRPTIPTGSGTATLDQDQVPTEYKEGVDYGEGAVVWYNDPNNMYENIIFYEAQYAVTGSATESPITQTHAINENTNVDAWEVTSISPYALAVLRALVETLTARVTALEEPANLPAYGWTITQSVTDTNSDIYRRYQKAGVSYPIIVRFTATDPTGYVKHTSGDLTDATYFTAVKALTYSDLDSVRGEL